MKIQLLTEAGEFCSSRKDPSIPRLRETVKSALLRNEPVEVDRQGTKSITVSFLDEWLGPLIAELGLAQIQSGVTFNPPLEPFLARQLERSERLRKRDRF